MQVRNVAISCLLGLLAISNAYAKDKSCKESIGGNLAQILVQQCINVSPATHPPCNASNSCGLIFEEIDRGCDILGKDGNKLNYCSSMKIEKQATLTGVLIGGGGQDDNSIAVLTNDGRRAWAYCSGRCGDDWFVPEGGDAGEGTTLSPRLIGKNVSVTFANEPNKSRIVGPDENEMLVFVKKIQFIK